MNEILIKKILTISENNDVNSAIELQKDMLDYIQFKGKLKALKTIAGVDISYSMNTGFCAIVVIGFDDYEIKQVVCEKKEIAFPYIPGLLFFREFPVFYDAFKKLTKIPDIIMFDGHGLSHPRMMGIATMSGIVLDIPTIGCAKSPLYGDYKEPDNKKFSFSILTNKGRKVGYVLRSKEKCKPIYISSGYKISPESALEITKELITKYRLPLPTYYAHKYATNFRNE
ncbi:MAG: endonuclease V [Brevinematia bacterium]